MVNKLNFLYNTNGLFILTVYVPSGSIYEQLTKYHNNENILGVSHFLEHLLFKHTENYTGKELLEAFTKIGGYYNASTDKDETMFYVKTLSENYELATKLIYDIVAKPIFETDEVNKERKVTLEELARSKDDLDDILYEESNKAFLCSENIYLSPVIGKKTHLENMTIKNIAKYFKLRFSDYLVVVNCDKKYKNQVKKHITAIFGKNKVCNFDDLSLTKLAECIQTDNNKKIRVIPAETYQYNTQLVFNGFKYSKVRNNILINFIKYCLTDSGLYSLLYYEMRDKRGLVYNIRMQNERMRYLGIVRIVYGTSNKDFIGILKVIFEVINNIKNNGLSHETLQFFKTSFISSMKYRFTNEEYRASWHGDNLFYGCTISEEQYLKYIELITNEDIKSMCKHIFDFTKMSVCTMGNYNDVEELKNNISNLISL
jgi:predicted Zn-dependent peptidase